MKLIEGSFGKQAPADLSMHLRDLADAVDRGEITSLIAAFVQDDNYEFMFAASRQEAIVLTTLMQHRNIERMMTHD
jgi:hypothetical protein